MRLSRRMRDASNSFRLTDIFLLVAGFYVTRSIADSTGRVRDITLVAFTDADRPIVAIGNSSASRTIAVPKRCSPLNDPAQTKSGQLVEDTSLPICAVDRTRQQQ